MSKKRPLPDQNNDSDNKSHNKGVEPKSQLSEESQEILAKFFGTGRQKGEGESARIKIDSFRMIESTQETQEEVKQDDEQLLMERIINTRKGSSHLKTISADMAANYNDGLRIFVNRLQYYKDSAVEEHMLSFKQLMFKDLGFKSKLKGGVEVKAAVITTMIFDLEMLDDLLESRIPLTVFLDRNRQEKGPQVSYNEKLNLNFVFQQKWGSLDYGIFHSKIILYEFDDRLRVIVPSANLYQIDWEHMSNVIWFQDFFPMSKSQEELKQDDICEFQ